MKYIVQNNHSFVRHQAAEDVFPFAEWPEEEWKPINPKFDGHDCLEKAIVSFENYINLFRVICPARIIDSDGIVHRIYDIEQDTRLPGCRWRVIRRNAYYLWEKAGRPVSDGVEFWEKAVATLQEDNGVIIF